MILERKPSVGDTFAGLIHIVLCDIPLALLAFWLYYGDARDHLVIRAFAILTFCLVVVDYWKSSWPASLALRIELVSSPREARCRRQNGITRWWSLHTYPIADDAKVTLICFPERGDSAAYFRIHIDGVPKYYNLYDLAYGQSRQEAFQIARTAAHVLGIRLAIHPEYAEVVEEYPVGGGNLFIPHGPRSKEEEHRSRKIRWRRRRKRKPK
jgi:hypothetical protein